MPRYFFTTADGSREPDLDGTELPNIAAARAEAVRFAGEVLCDHPSLVWEGDDFRIEVTDGTGLLLFTVVTMATNAPAGGSSREVSTSAHPD